MDPIDLREKNGARDGIKAPYGPTFQNIGFLETLEAVKAQPHYDAAQAPTRAAASPPGFWFNVGGEFTGGGARREDGTRRRWSPATPTSAARAPPWR